MGSINVNSVLITVQDISSKNQSGGYLSPDEFNNFAALAQREIVNEVYQLLDINRSATALISPVIKVEGVNVTSNYVDKPTDYSQIISFYAMTFNSGAWSKKEAENLNQTEIGDRLRSQIDNPTIDYPVVVSDMNGLRVYPDGISRGELSYIYDFPDPIYATTGTPPVYDPVNSVDFVLDDLFFDIVVYKVCLLFGISVKDANLQQTSVRSIIKAI